MTPRASVTWQNNAVLAAKSSGGTVVIWSADPLAQFERDLIEASLKSSASGIGSVSRFVYFSGEGASSSYGISVDSSNVTFSKTSDWTMFWTGTYSRSGSGSSSLSNSLSNVYVGARKIWVDDNNRDGIRPGSLTVELYANGTATGSTLVMSETNSWTAQWQNLPKYRNGAEIAYSVKEVGEISGYKASYSVDGDTGTHIITNTHEIATTSITATKAWEDNNDQDGIRPDSVTLTVYANGVSTGRTVELTAASGWTATVEGLPLNENGKPITYTMVEETPAAGYTASTSGTTVTNTHISETIDIPVSKVWNDNDDQDGFRPDSVTVRLLADGVEVDDQTITAGTDWKHTFTGLAKYRDGGVEIVYTITEAPVAEYETSIRGYTVTNTHTPKTSDLSVTKVWDDNNDQDGKRADSVTISLYGNDKSTPLGTVTLSESNNWTGVWKDLPMYSGGNPVNYTVTETGATKSGADYSVVSAGYTITHAYNNAEGSPFRTEATVTNKYTPETIGLNVQKSWDDNDNQDGVRPASVTVELYYRVGEQGTWTATGKTLELNPGNEWDVTFTGLAKFAGGEMIYYNVVEEAVEGYTAQYSIDFSDKTYVTTVVNTHTPNVTSVTVTKDWVDSGDQDGIRPGSVMVTLYGRDKSAALGTAVLSDENGWSHTWNGLPENYAGNPIVYTVVEETVSGYTAQITRGTADNGGILLAITNTHIPETTAFPFEKVWDDNHDQDGKRPDTVTVNLLANGNQVDTIDLKADNLWKHIFAGLPKYEAGVKITYTLEEVPVADYDTQINADTGVITNTHVPETVTIVANKVWNDADGQDGKRPAYIELHLLASGDHVFAQPQKVTADEDGNWSYTWSGLPKYNDGQLIRYSVTENAVYNERGKAYSTNYDVSRSADGNTITATITNSLTPEKTALTVEKVWDDTYNQDGLRPDSVTVELYANDVATGKTVTLHKDHGWIATFTELDEYQDGVKVAYRVVEKNVPEGYEASYETDTLTGMIKVINKHEIQKTSVTVSKVWVDDDNQDGIRPASINVTLYADGTPVKTITITAADHWQGSFADLNRYAAGKEILYEVKELTVDGYTTTITGNAESGFEITNAHETEKTSVKVSKVWVDGENRDGSRPDTLNVTLYRDGEAFQTAVLSKNDDWTWEFTGLDVHYANGKTHVYTVGETVPGGYTITNTHEPATISIPVTKVWNDAGNQDGIRPGSVTVALLADRVEIDTYTLTAADNWRHVFEGMQ